MIIYNKELLGNHIVIVQASIHNMSFRVSGLRFEGLDSRFRVGLGFGIQGLGLSVGLRDLVEYLPVLVKSGRRVYNQRSRLLSPPAP